MYPTSPNTNAISTLARCSPLQQLTQHTSVPSSPQHLTQHMYVWPQHLTQENCASRPTVYTLIDPTLLVSTVLKTSIIRK